MLGWNDYSGNSYRTNSLGADETFYAGGIGVHWRGLGMGIGMGGR